MFDSLTKSEQALAHATERIENDDDDDENRLIANTDYIRIPDPDDPIDKRMKIDIDTEVRVLFAEWTAGNISSGEFCAKMADLIKQKEEQKALK